MTGPEGIIIRCGWQKSEMLRHNWTGRKKQLIESNHFVEVEFFFVFFSFHIPFSLNYVQNRDDDR